jgi:hypothetical protein
MRSFDQRTGTFGHDGAKPLKWLWPQLEETGRGEILIKCKSLAEAPGAHHFEARRIYKRVSPLIMLP